MAGKIVDYDKVHCLSGRLGCPQTLGCDRCESPSIGHALFETIKRCRMTRRNSTFTSYLTGDYHETIHPSSHFLLPAIDERSLAQWPPHIHLDFY